MVILLTIWWKTLGVLIIRMQNILVWVLFHGIMVVKMSSWWVENGTYIRLKSMQIGYTLPSQWVTPAGIKKVRFYVSGGNLLTFSHLKHLDPEMPSVNQGYYPQQRTYELGLNVTF